MQCQLDASRTQLKLTDTGTGNFSKQDMIVTSIVKNLVGAGGIAIQVVQRDWFRQFIHDVEARFKPVSRVARSFLHIRFLDRTRWAKFHGQYHSLYL